MSGHIGTGNCDKHGHYVSTLGCPRCLAKGPLDGSPLESVVQGRTESPVPSNPDCSAVPIFICPKCKFANVVTASQKICFACALFEALAYEYDDNADA